MLTLKKKPVDGLKFFGWVGHPLAVFGLVVGLLCGSCKTIYVPLETGTTVNVKDSTVLHIKDSIRITERSRWKEWGGLLDELVIEGNRATARCWADTTRNILAGELEESPIEEKVRIIYKDRWKTKDSLVFRDVPIEVPGPEKIIKVVPKFWRVTGIIGLISILFGLVYAFIKLKTGGFIDKILKIFKG